jgi:import inner membrane translocase subunit TIM17
MERYYRRLFHRKFILYRRQSVLIQNSQGGSLAVRGGYKSMRNGAIGCAILLAVIEGVGIGFQRMMAENTKLEPPPPIPQPAEPIGGRALA